MKHLPKRVVKRQKGVSYLFKGRVVLWNGKRIMCSHGRKRCECKDCGGSSICSHGRRRSRCKDCGGSQVCSHGRQRIRCKDCGGSQICSHGRRRSECKDCGGSQICSHGRQRGGCTEGSCGLKASSGKCVTLCGKTVKRVPGVPTTHLCATCRDEFSVHTRKKFEQQMEAWLDEHGLNWSYSNKKLPCAPTTRYPDYLFIASAEHAVLLEVDEHEHRDYNVSCEVARISEIMDSIGHTNLHVIRFNPNEVGATTETRRTRVLEALDNAIQTNFGRFSDTGCVVQYVGYSHDRMEELEQITCDLQQPAARTAQ